MFVRFRETATRLQMSVTETRRLNGRVQNEHVASFGSVPLPLTVPDRIEFWRRLHDRLAKLSNRIDAATQAKILGQIHARTPPIAIRFCGRSRVCSKAAARSAMASSIEACASCCVRVTSNRVAEKLAWLGALVVTQLK